MKAGIAADVCPDRAVAGDAKASLRASIERLMTRSASALEVCMRLCERPRRNQALNDRLGVGRAAKSKQGGGETKGAQETHGAHLVKMNGDDVDQRRQDQHEEQWKVQNVPRRKKPVVNRQSANLADRGMIASHARTPRR